MANEQNLTPFPKGNNANPNGRPKKWVSQLRDSGYKLSEVNDAIQVLMQMTVEELKDVWDNKNSTVLEKTIAGAIKKSIEKGSLYSIETLLTRVYGKPKETVDSNVKLSIEQPLFPDVHTDNSNK